MMFECFSCFTRFFFSDKGFWGSIFLKDRKCQPLSKCQISELHSTENRASYRSSSISDTLRCDGRRSRVQESKTGAGLAWHLYSAGLASRCQGLPRRVSVSSLPIITAISTVSSGRNYFCVGTTKNAFSRGRAHTGDPECPFFTSLIPPPRARRNTSLHSFL